MSSHSVSSHLPKGTSNKQAESTSRYLDGRDVISPSLTQPVISPSKSAGRKKLNRPNKPPSAEWDKKKKQHICHTCNRSFGDEHDLSIHYLKAPQHNWCFRCAKDFSTPTDLATHEARYVSYGCGPTSKGTQDGSGENIPTHQALSDAGVPPAPLPAHIAPTTRPPTQPTVMHLCLTCSFMFPTIPALRSHCVLHSHVPNPLVCEVCETSFTDVWAFQAHEKTSKHCIAVLPAVLRRQEQKQADTADKGRDTTEALSCPSCGTIFSGGKALFEHLTTATRHSWCFRCSKDLPSPKALRSHERSSAHHERDPQCPLPDCTSTFTRTSEVAVHLQSGFHGAPNRHRVAAVDHPSHPDTSMRDLQVATAVQSSSSGFIATELSFDGFGYKCAVCPRSYRSLAILNAHLSSAAHGKTLFTCAKCIGVFTRISALVQHVESRSCVEQPQLHQGTDMVDKLSASVARRLRL
ncbi:hypothetical protein B0H34DRAFT_737583 [Crassisporium funariophilum]|nr:hypothetical protein B0H34DRAFT_737583 [Crassisporium funariophilum]